MKSRAPRDEARISVRFKDAKPDDFVRRHLETRCERLTKRFPETNRIEITLAADGERHFAHGHVTGKGTEVATQAAGVEIREAADRLLVRIERQLRREHDKRVFVRRRAVQRTSLKR